MARALAALFGAVAALWLAASSAAGESLVLPVPLATIYPGEVITREALGTARFRPSMPARNIVARRSGEIIGKVATRTLLPRRAVPLRAVREADLVGRGQTVEVVFRRGGVTIRAKALTLEAGGLGAWVRARNLDTGRIVAGTVAPDGTLMVGG